MINIHKLKEDHSHLYAEELFGGLEKELYKQKGFISQYKEPKENDRKSRIEELISTSALINNFDLIDTKINDIASLFNNINFEYTAPLEYEFNEILKTSDLSNFPLLSSINEILTSADESEKIKDKLKSILAKGIYKSVSQSKKTNAGEAGKHILKTFFKLIGFDNYSSEFRSGTGSATDFVIPKNSRSIADIEILIAVQISSNDRTRMVKSELRDSCRKYIFSCNGLNPVKKSIKDIGTDILKDLKEKHIHYVGYKFDIEKENYRILNSLDELDELNAKHQKKINELKSRKDYLNEYSCSFEDFARYLKDRTDLWL